MTCFHRSVPLRRRKKAMPSSSCSVTLGETEHFLRFALSSLLCHCRDIISIGHLPPRPLRPRLARVYCSYWVFVPVWGY